MDVQLSPATEEDLPFARALTRRTMLPYYTRFDLFWQDDAFDEAWHWRENLKVRKGGDTLGFISLSTDAGALYIRELHLIEAARGRGAGGQVLEYVIALAAERRISRLRLMVFRTNPAQALYRRKGFEVVGEDDCFLRMERATLR